MTTNEMSPADLQAVLNGSGDGFGFGGNGAWWIIFLFFAMMFGWGGFGNGAGNSGGGYTPIQQGFDQAAIMNGISGINQSLANAEVSRCNQQATLLQALNTNATNQTAAMNGIAMSLQNCCCENRAATADLKYTVATEACNDRAAITAALQSVTAQNAANTQRILDQMCADKIDAKNEEIANLRTQLNMATLRESQTAQTATILANNQAQTVALEQYLNPAPIPAYVVQNPNCCSSAFSSCGCNA